MSTPDALKLSTLAIATELLPGDFVPMLRTSAAQDKDKNPRAPIELFNLPTNDAKSGFKFYRYRTRFEAGQPGAYGGAVLEELDYLTLCTFARLVVERYRNDPTNLAEQPHYQELVAVYSGEPDAPRGYRDGSFSGDLIGLQLVPANSAATAVPAYDSLPAGYQFKVDELVRDYVAGTPSELFFAAKKTGPLPAPSAAAGDDNWRRVAEADVPVPGPGGDTVDLLGLTTDQMLEVMALGFTDCDAAPADSPAWSCSGMQFDAIYQGKNCHFYCSRGTFDPAAPAGTTGAGPAWHYFIKLG